MMGAHLAESEAPHMKKKKKEKEENRTPVVTVNRPRFLQPELTCIQIKPAAPGEFQIGPAVHFSASQLFEGS